MSTADDSMDSKATFDLFQTQTGKDTNTASPSEPKANEGIPPVEPINTENHENNVASDDSKIIEKEKSKLHYTKLDLIESAFEQGDDAAKAFFEKNKELAETANKSVKFKERYRSLMEDAKVEQPQSNAILDEEGLISKIEANIIRKQQEKENQAALKNFMVREGLNADNEQALLKSAKALSDATGKPFDQVLSHAKNALFGSFDKPKPINLPDSTARVNVQDRDAEVKRIMASGGIPKHAAEAYLDSIKIDTDESGKNVGTTFKII